MATTRPPRRASVSRGHSNQRQPVKFDADMEEGVDPEGAWRFQNSTKFQRKGSTRIQREGMDPSYTPGYGRAAAANRPMGFTPKPEFDALFTPQLSTPQAGPAPMQGPPMPPGLPPTAKPAIPPMTPSPGDVSRATPPAPMTPNISTATGTQSAVRTVQGLPTGQSASSSFVPGQNTKANLAKRTRPPVDPLS